MEFKRFEKVIRSKSNYEHLVHVSVGSYLPRFCFRIHLHFQKDDIILSIGLVLFDIQFGYQNYPTDDWND